MKTITRLLNLLLVLSTTFPLTAKTFLKKKNPHLSLSSNQVKNLPDGFYQQQTSTVTFTENKGQISDQNYKARPDVLFSGNTNGLSYYIRNNGISYQLSRVDSWKEEGMLMPHAPNIKTENKKIPDQTTLYQIDIGWLNQNSNFTIEKGNTLAGYNNYYLAACPSGVLNVKTYTDITLKNIYNNIDLHYYEKAGTLEYDYLIAPHADYRQIQLKVGGAVGITLQKDGSIVLKTPLGDITEKAPLVYQHGKVLKAMWVVTNNTLSFDVKNYNSSLPLVIDPTVTRLWGTYYGALGIGNSCTTDTANNVYMTGFTYQTTTLIDTISSVGSHQILSGGASDAYLVKFDPDGIRLWGTYYGGRGDETAYSCATDFNNNVYVTGVTALSYITDTTLGAPSGGDTIASIGSHQGIYGGGNKDAFLVKFNSAGVRQWSTYYGSSGDEIGYSCATDAMGNVYMTGVAQFGGDTIATAGSHQASFGGYNDAFLVKFNSIGVRQWSTYYGGSGDELGRYCATDIDNNVYMVGYTTTSGGDTIATPTSHQPTFAAGAYNGFLVKFNTSGVRQWGTYYGGSGGVWGQSCASDVSGNIYMSGIALSASGGDTIATVSSHQPTCGGGTDAFLVKFSAGGTRQWATYYGGSGSEYNSNSNTTCCTDASGNVYMTGVTFSIDTTAIATNGSWQNSYSSYDWGDSLEYGHYNEDAYLVKFNYWGIRQWGTYYGSLGDEEGVSCTTDQLGHIYISGYANSSITYNPAITSSTAWQPTVSEVSDHAILVQFTECTSSLGTPSITQHGDTLVASPAATYEWHKDGSWIPGAIFQSYLPTETGNYTVCSTAHGELCKVCSAPFSFTTGINEHTLANAIAIYPNPNNGQFEIALQLNTQDNYTLELTNALGQVLYHEELKNYVGAYHKQLDETKYGAGIYLFRVKNSKEQSVKKVISW